MPYQILIIDDQPVIRAAYRQIIDRESDLLVCGEAESGAEALAQVAQKVPDIVLLDISMPEMNGLEVLQRLKQLYPGLPVLIISGLDELIYAPYAIKLGASGFIDKTNVVQALAQAIRKVKEGGCYISRRVKSIFPQDQFC